MLPFYFVVERKNFGDRPDLGYIGVSDNNLLLVTVPLQNLGKTVTLSLKGGTQCIYSKSLC